MYTLHCFVVGCSGGGGVGCSVILFVVDVAVITCCIHCRAGFALYFAAMSFCCLLQLREVLSDCFCSEARPQWELPVFDRHDPCWLGGESHRCMVVADNLRLSLELVDVCYSLGWGSLLGTELCWQAVAKYCLGFLFCMCFTSEMHHSFVWLQRQPWSMAAHVTMIFVLFES